jgi:hypothetical protein
MINGMIARVTKFKKWCVMEKNMEKFEVMRISRKPSPLMIMVDQERPENVEYLKYLD